MKLNHLYLPILLSGTLFLTGCGTVADEQGINKDTSESQQDDKGTGSNTDSDNGSAVDDGTDSGSGSGTDNEPDTGNEPGIDTGSGTDNEPDSGNGSTTDSDSNTGKEPDSDTGSNTDSNNDQSQQDPVVIPGMAVLVNMSDQLELINGAANLQINWQKNSGNEANYWNVLLNGEDASVLWPLNQALANSNQGKPKLALTRWPTTAFKYSYANKPAAAPIAASAKRSI